MTSIDFYFKTDKKIPDNTKILYDSEESKGLIGLHDVLNYLFYLIAMKKTGISEKTIKYLDEINLVYNINFIDLKITENEIFEKIKEILEYLTNRQSKLLTIKDNINYTLIILDRTIDIENEKLKVLSNLINDIGVINKHQVIMRDLLENKSISEKNRKFLNLYNQVNSAIDYLRNIRIAKDNTRILLDNKSTNIRNTDLKEIYIKKYMENESNNVKRKLLNLIENEDIDSLIDIWKNDKVKELIEELKNEVVKDVIVSENYLYPKLVYAMKKLLNISSENVRQILEEKNFREMIFPGETLQGLSKQYSRIVNELNELEKVITFINNLLNKVYYCPYCTLLHSNNGVIMSHIKKVHKKLYNITKESPIYNFNIIYTKGNYKHIYSEDLFSDKNSVISDFIVNYIKRDDSNYKMYVEMSDNIKGDIYLKSINEPITNVTISKILPKIDLQLEIKNQMNYYKNIYKEFVELDIIEENDLDHIIKEIFKGLDNIKDVKKSKHKIINKRLSDIIMISYGFYEELEMMVEDVFTNNLLESSIKNNKNKLLSELDNIDMMLNLPINENEFKHFNTYNSVKIYNLYYFIMKVFRTNPIDNYNSFLRLFMSRIIDDKTKKEEIDILFDIVLLFSSYSNTINVFYDYLKESEEINISIRDNVNKSNYWEWRNNEENLFMKMKNIVDTKSFYKTITEEVLEKIYQLDDFRDIINIIKNTGLSKIKTLEKLYKHYKKIRELFIRLFREDINKDSSRLLITKIQKLDLWMIKQISYIFDNTFINDLLIRFVKLDNVYYVKSKVVKRTGTIKTKYIDNEIDDYKTTIDSVKEYEGKEKNEIINDFINDSFVEFNEDKYDIGDENESLDVFGYE